MPTIWTPGTLSLSRLPTPLIVPPVPTPATKWVIPETC
jgi:hypothetical protein